MKKHIAGLKNVGLVVVIGIVVLVGWGMWNFLKTQVKTPHKAPSKAKTVAKRPRPGLVKEKKKRKKKEEEVPAIPLPLEQLLKGKEEKIPVRVYKVSRTDFQDSLPIVGTIKSIPEIDLKFEINGYIKEIRFKEGERVGKGVVIARLDPRDAQLELSWAKAKLASVRSEAKAVRKRMEVIQKLYEMGAIIEAKLEEMKAEVKAAEDRVKVAEVEVESAKARLEKTNLYAPRKGIMGPREMDVGEFVTPNDRIATLLSLDNLMVEVGVIEKDIYKIQVGQRAKIFVDAYPKTEFNGIIESIFPVLEGKSRTLTVRINLFGTKGVLMPGMFARVEVYIYSKKNAIIVPTTALITERQRYFVSTVKNDRVQNREVTLEYLTTDYAVIKRGVDEGTLVVVETPGLKKLRDGTPLEIIEVQEKLSLGS